MQRIIIEIQHFHGCPNSPVMIGNVKEAIGITESYSELRSRVEYREVLIEDNESARAVGFRGSPTLLIDGEDYEGMAEAENGGLTCRYYENGVPTVEEIRRRLEDKCNQLGITNYEL